MTPRAGDILELTAERAVAGGRMLARHAGQVTLLAGAIPGERVRARVERATRQVLWAETIDVLEPSRDRRVPSCDLACGGSLYAHIAYERQRQIKGDVIADAFRRVGKLPLEPPAVRPSPETGYRMRARLHVQDRRAGFFREGSHSLCDARTTGQLHPGAVDAADALLETMGSRAADCGSIVVAENIPASERVLHLEPREGTRLDDWKTAGPLAGVTGITTSLRGRVITLAGLPTVSDSADRFLAGGPPLAAPIVWTRHAASFFQANRFLVGDLVRRVLDASAADTCVDLYAGVGLFAVSMTARGSRVIAVEGDPVGAADLRSNAEPFHGRLEVVQAAVEDFLSRPSVDRPNVAVLDPPRTGVARQTLAALIAWRPPRLVYVSCDPATLARDASGLVAAGYRLTSIDAFDLFPNTPHVETVVVLEKVAG